MHDVRNNLFHTFIFYTKPRAIHALETRAFAYCFCFRSAIASSTAFRRVLITSAGLSAENTDVPATMTFEPAAPHQPRHP